MPNRFLPAVFLFTVLIISACTPENSKIIVAKFDDQVITLKQFEKAYIKNNSGLNGTEKVSFNKLKKFLKLYTDFRMKLKDAQVRGLDKDPEILKELNTYKKEIGRSYLIEKRIIEPGLKKLYSRRKYEIRISHILIRPQKGSWLAAKKLAESIIQKIRNGAKFTDMVKKYSEDSYSKKYGGDIYWFTAGMLPPNFIDAAYSTPVGNIYSKPVKSAYGYHIIKVTAKQKRVPAIRCRHILISYYNQKGKLDTTAALTKIKAIRDSLINGASFTKLAKKYSADKMSAARGGDLGFFQRRKMAKPFDEAAFKLKVNQISGIVKTRFGFHVIQLLAKKKYPLFNKVKKKLKRIYDKNRYEIDYRNYIKKLKKEYHYKPNNGLNNYFAEIKDTVYVYNYKTSKLSKAIGDSTAFTAGGKSFIVDSLFSDVKNNPRFRAERININLYLRALNRYSDDVLLTEKSVGLEKTDPVFASLMKSYKEGIIIFKLQQEKIWDKIKIDSLKLKKFYEKTKSNYKFPTRVAFHEIFVLSKSLINNIFNKLKNGANFDSLALKYTERRNYKSKAGNFGLVAVSYGELSKKAYSLKKPGDFSKPFKYTRGWSIVKLDKKVPSKIKSFKQAKAEVISAYQNKLSKIFEDKYINRLKKIYQPVFNYDVLKKAFKKNID